MMFGVLMTLVRTRRFRTLGKRRKRRDAAAQERERAYEQQYFAREPNHEQNLVRRPGQDKGAQPENMRNAVLSAARK